MTVYTIFLGVGLALFVQFICGLIVDLGLIYYRHKKLEDYTQNLNKILDQFKDANTEDEYQSDDNFGNRVKNTLN